MSSPDIDEQVAELLGAVDQRYTAGRRKLVNALQAGEGPLTIKQIASAAESLPQSSIYRNLTMLEEAGAVTRVVTNDEFARYELAEGLTEHHHHLICTDCGVVIDFALDHDLEHTLDRELEQAAQRVGFTATNHRLDLLGVCSSCTPA